MTPLALTPATWHGIIGTCIVIAVLGLGAVYMFWPIITNRDTDTHD